VEWADAEPGQRAVGVRPHERHLAGLEHERRVARRHVADQLGLRAARELDREHLLTALVDRVAVVDRLEQRDARPGLHALRSAVQV
jgi:hypothetical protein